MAARRGTQSAFCILNVSEGRDAATLACFKSLFEKEGVRVLHIDQGRGANRTVFSLFGDLPEICRGLVAGYDAALRMIDMRRHRGTHPRIGAFDVVPIVPWEGTSLDQCRSALFTIGQMVSRSFQLPVFYVASARIEGNEKVRTLSYIRVGGYEGLAQRLISGDLVPDNQECHPVLHPSLGASILGVRQIMIAWNVTLSTSKVAVAKNIAQSIRKVRRSNFLVLGWFIEEYGCAQVSFNLYNYREFGLFDAYRAVESLLPEGVEITGSELVGLAPRAAFGDSVDKAAKKLGLSLHTPFVPEERVIEYLLYSDSLVL